MTKQEAIQHLRDHKDEFDDETKKAIDIAIVCISCSIDRPWAYERSN